LLFAAFPALFGVQQLFEGWLWLSLAEGPEEASRLPAMSFLFFAYLLWLAVTPLAAFLVEDRLGAWRFRHPALAAPMLVCPSDHAIAVAEAARLSSPGGRQPRQGGS
jgi:hypothetical protein